MPLSTDAISLLVGSLAAVLLVVAAVILAFTSRRANRVLDDVGVSDGLVDSYVGGLRWQLPGHLGTASVPPVLVGLELYPWGLRIGARRSFLHPFVPAFYARYEEITVAEHVRRGMQVSRRFAHGIRLRTTIGGAPLIFWTSGWAGLLDSLEALGVAVVRQSTPAGAWSNR
jgi:hypothetical protein